MTVRNGRRMSAWTSFVEPVLDSPLLTVITGAQVDRLVFDGTGRAAGVRLVPALAVSMHPERTRLTPPRPRLRRVAGHRAALLGGRDRLRRA